MEEAPENGKESSHSAYANGMNISLHNIMGVSNGNTQNIIISVIE